MVRPYVPFLLPNDALIDKEVLFDKVIDANRSLAIYNEKMNNSKIRPDLLLDLLSLKEALESSRIEGTQATMDEMFEFRAEETNATIDITEVINYRNALSEGVYILERLPISTRFFKMLHRTLLHGHVRGENKNPGEFRTVQNFIGPSGCTIETASFVPPEPQLISTYMSNLEKFINEDSTTNDLIKIAIIHAQFETIHPFLDGNGRIGRILIPLYLYNKGLISSANLFVSESLEKDKYKYYRLLNNTRILMPDKDTEEYENALIKAKNNYTEWITFFLNACIAETNKGIEKIEKINALYDETLTQAKMLINNNKVTDLINILFEYPVFTTKTIRNRSDISPATLNTYLKKLVDANIIHSDDRPRNRRYYFYDLMDVLR